MNHRSSSPFQQPLLIFSVLPGFLLLFVMAELVYQNSTPPVSLIGASRSDPSTHRQRNREYYAVHWFRMRSIQRCTSFGLARRLSQAKLRLSDQAERGSVAVDVRISDCRTPLPAALQVNAGGTRLFIRTVGDAYHLISNYSTCLEYHELQRLACEALEGAANGEQLQMQQAITALRALLSVAKLV
jgi:hypothetical protein